MKTVGLRIGRVVSGLMVSMSLFEGVFGCGSGSPSDQSNHESSVVVHDPPGRRAGPVVGTATTSQLTSDARSLPTPDPSTRTEKPLAGADQVATTPMNLKVSDRLNDLETWARQGFPGGDDPLWRALNDPDERVRARAQELMEGEWSAAIAADYHVDANK